MSTKSDLLAYLTPPEKDSKVDDRRYAAAGFLSTLLKTSKSNEQAKALTSEDVSVLLE